MPSADQSPDGGLPAALQPDPSAVIPRISLGEQGFLGLKTRNGFIWEEPVLAFRYPQFIRTINEMRNNPTVGAALTIYRLLLSRVEWDVQPPSDATEQEKERAAIVKTMMDDMEQSWGNFIESIIPYLEYGFSVNEKVFRRRLKRNGSRWNDGLVGIKKLPVRSQETISRWVFSEDGADLIRVEQNLQYLENGARFLNRTNERGLIEIPREKFLLFTCSGTKGNPEGNSILKPIYLAFKQLSLLADQELLSIAKDVQGILKIEIPPKYLDPNASAEDKAVVSAFQTIINNYNAGTSRGLLVPNMIDPESKLNLFKYELMSDRGTPKIDTEAVIKRLQNDILSALSVDVLKMGADGTGSFSLADAKTSILALAIDYRLKEIAEVLNMDLMRSLYEMNGWSTERLPKFVYSDIEKVSLDELGKYLQRVKAVGLVEVDRPILNRVREAMGVPAKGDDEAPDVDAMTLTDTQSRSGDSLNTPSGGMNGTANSVSPQDNSAANTENAE